jgi:hypothetical protein
MGEESFSEDSNIDGNGRTVIGRKSWVVYFFIILNHFFIFAIYTGVFLYFFQDRLNDLDTVFKHKGFIIFICLFALHLLWFLYLYLSAKSHLISIDREGVWYTAGLFPWQKVGNGIRWQDIDMPFRSSNFISWITNSHSITVKHKYTNLDDFVVTHIWDGQKVINIIATERSQRVQ